MIPSNIIIDGERVGRYTKIIVDGDPIWLPDKCFKYIAILAIARRLDLDDGWVNSDVFDGMPRTRQYMSRLKKEIHSRLPILSQWDVIENNIGCYKLLIENPDEIEIKESVGKFEDSKVFNYYLEIENPKE